jgi:CrcB protein
VKELVTLFLVGIGGFIGSVARYAAGGFVHRLLPGFSFPWGTVAVNLVGCFLIGLLAGLAQSKQVMAAETRLFVMIGILGGFTTFSTFGYETFALMRDGESLRALGNVLLQVGAGLAAVWVGFTIIR